MTSPALGKLGTMSAGVDEASASASSGRNAASSSASASQPQVAVTPSAGDQTFGSIQSRNGVTSPASPGSEADSTINSATFAPSILASRLGRSIYSSAGAAASTISLSGSGFKSPSLALTGFNAISTVLNNPSKRQHPIDPKSSRFPPVTPNHVPADIPKVKKADLDNYLSSVRPEWDRFMRNQSMGRQGKATIEQQQQQQQQLQQQQHSHDSSYDSNPVGKNGSRHRSTASMASLSADLQAVPPPQARKRLPNLSAVPQIFFSEEFDLGNPYTFDQVTERYKVASTSPSEQNGGTAPTYDVALNQMLQEKLSYYSDVIEQHLIIEIGQQSSSFFAALENLNDLNAEAESCLRKIDHLKAELDSIDDNQAKKGLQVLQQQHHRRHLERKQAIVQDVRQVVERRDLVRLLLQQGETEEALDLLNKLRSALRLGDIQPEHVHNAQIATPKAANSAPSTEDKIALSDLQCLASIPSQLDEMEGALSGMLEQDFIAILRQDIDSRLSAYRQSGAFSASSAGDDSYFGKTAVQPNQPVLTPNTAATDSGLMPSKPPASPFGNSSRALSNTDSQLASRIAPLVIGLAKTGGIEKAVSAYREVAIQAVRETWRSTLSLPSAEMAETAKWLLNEDLSAFDDHENLPPPAARIRDMEHSSFLSIGQELFETLLECLKAIDAQCRLVPRILDESNSGGSLAQKPSVENSNLTDSTTSIDAASSSLPLPPIMPTGVPTSLPAKLSEVVVASAEQAHSLCARLLSLRATTHAALELPPFLIVFQLCWGFVLASEQLCRKMIVGLRGTILGQAKGFLATFHRRRIERAAKAVEEETWAQADVGAKIQAQIRHIVSSAVEDPADFVVTGSHSQLNGDSDELSKESRVAEADADAAVESSKTLDIEDRQYFVVDASLEVLALLVDYLKVVINLPLLTTEAMARVVEFLKQFNSRTCQVVLGAGAMRSAGLKNITAKHLALASQSLSIMISLIPYIRETVRRHLSSKQAVLLTEFDKLRRDFQEHQYEIHAKLVAIMSDRLTVHCRTLNAIDWNVEKASAGEQEGDESKDAEPNKYAADLVKETATLHKVLSKYLQSVVVEHVIGQVLRAIDARIAQEFEKIPVQNQRALDRMQTDVRYLGTKLSGLKHVEWKDEALQQVLVAKRVPQTPVVNVTTSAGSSTPNSEVAPGSPSLDKPAASPLGPVTYKPRIPNIFARRQQQQQGQLGSPRASADVTGTSTPMESQRSLEGTPRSSLQMQQQSSQTAAQTSAAAAQDVTTAETPQAAEGSSTRADTAGARSLEEEANEVPPTPPSKSEEMPSTAIIKSDDADPRESEDLVAPVVPAPDAVAKVLTESGRASSELTAAAPPTPAAEPEVESAQQNADDDTAKAEAVSVDQQEAAPTDAASLTKDAEGLVQEASTGAPKPDEALIPAADSSDVTEPREPQRPSTPKKDAPSTALRTNATAESSPARSGASTPATTTPTGTPAKPGRMSLKERLAEAARKRAQQSGAAARSSGQVEASKGGDSQKLETAASGSATATADRSEVKAETKEQASESGAEPSGDVQIVEAAVSADKTVGITEEAHPVSAAQESDTAEANHANDESEPREANVTAANAEASKVDVQDAAEDQEEGEQAMSGVDQVQAEEAVTVVETRTDAAKENNLDDHGDAPTGSTSANVDTTSTEQQTGSTEAAEVESTAETVADAPMIAAGVHTDEDAVVDEDDAEAEVEINEGTIDSALGTSSGGTNKKGKKKKKKSRKK